MKTLYLVTAAAGYLGGEVCRQLVERGLHGRALVLPGDKTAQYIPREIEQCEGDLCDTASLERFFSVAPDTETIVLHCASMVALGNERRELVMKVNVQGTQNIIDQCFARLECKKLVYVGSTGAIQELPHGQRMKESECFVPEESFGVYGQSKAMASQLVLDAAKAGLNACIVMPSGILGPGDAACGPVTSGLLMQMRGEVSVGLKGTFNLCDVRDLANGLFLAVEKGKTGESYIESCRFLLTPTVMCHTRILLHGICASYIKSVGYRKIITCTPCGISTQPICCRKAPANRWRHPCWVMRIRRSWSAPTVTRRML